jgi:hypothetical protein
MKNKDKMTSEELKTIIGSIMYDLRCDWTRKFRFRVNKLKKHLHELSELVSKEEAINIHELISFADLSFSSQRGSEMRQKNSYGNYYGSIFRHKYLYCYASNEGCTPRVKTYLEKLLLHPDVVIKDNWNKSKLSS